MCLFTIYTQSMYQVISLKRSPILHDRRLSQIRARVFDLRRRRRRRHVVHDDDECAICSLSSHGNADNTPPSLWWFIARLPENGDVKNARLFRSRANSPVFPRSRRVAITSFNNLQFSIYVHLDTRSPFYRFLYIMTLARSAQRYARRFSGIRLTVHSDDDGSARKNDAEGEKERKKERELRQSLHCVVLGFQLAR